MILEGFKSRKMMGCGFSLCRKASASQICSAQSSAFCRTLNQPGDISDNKTFVGINIDYAQDFDFDKVETFAYVATEDTNAADPLMHGRIEEAIVEELGVKQALFQQLETICGVETLLATNTSSLSVTAIAARRARTRPGPASSTTILDSMSS